MKKCIICGTEKDDAEFNIEHVIPESAGSSFTIDNVCKECNNHLGRTVDKKFLENSLIKLYLSKFNIKNKKGKLPQFWTKLPVRKNSKIKAIPQYDRINNQFKGWKYSNALINSKGSKHLVFDSGEKIEDVLSEFSDDELDKEKIKKEFYKGNYSEEQQELILNMEIHLEDLFLEAIKISYEFASYVLGEEYLDDSLAFEFRKILLNPSKISENIEKYFLRYDFEESIFKDTLHTIFLIRDDKSLFVCTNLFNCFAFSVEVSRNLNLIPQNFIGNFLLINIDRSFSDYYITTNNLEILDLYSKLKYDIFK
ncbi:HNH endonuclease [Methanobrevibacter ruminantium]|uniref:HNH endonuclease n=1 Tax=Methanobrevibacter ruminantium TaxID=83816 RepID=UPI0026EE157D|nr:HNH endonuclease [Methanobrevibacter ruminantium]